jgi:DNA-binding response OmpR family regulator
MRLLIVEDDRKLAEFVARGLRAEHFAVDIAGDGLEGQRYLDAYQYDLLIVDLMLPKLSGGELLRRLRRIRGTLPVLVLTARDATDDKVKQFEAGADDYLTKPFDLGELLARVKALIRRGKGVAHPLITLGRLRVNTIEQTVKCEDLLVDLSPTEYRIFEYLIFRPRAIVSKRELLEHLYDYRWEHHSNVIEAHVSNLRKKLRAMGEEATVETIRGRGYRLFAPESPQ